jgi:hypothetical protein
MGPRNLCPPLFGWPAQDICGLGFSPEIGIQDGNTGVIAGQYAHLDLASLAKVVQNRLAGDLGQGVKVDPGPTRILDQYIGVQVIHLAGKSL